MRDIDKLQRQLEIFVFFENRRIDLPKMTNTDIYKDIAKKFNMKLGGVIALFATKDMHSTYLQLVSVEEEARIKNLRRGNPSFNDIKLGSEKTVPRMKYKKTPTCYDDNYTNTIQYLQDHR
jgi:hypothetical protein